MTSHYLADEDKVTNLPGNTLEEHLMESLRIIIKLPKSDMEKIVKNFIKKQKSPDIYFLPDGFHSLKKGRYSDYDTKSLKHLLSCAKIAYENIDKKDLARFKEP